MTRSALPLSGELGGIRSIDGTLLRCGLSAPTRLPIRYGKGLKGSGQVPAPVCFFDRRLPLCERHFPVSARLPGRYGRDILDAILTGLLLAFVFSVFSVAKRLRSAFGANAGGV